MYTIKQLLNQNRLRHFSQQTDYFKKINAALTPCLPKRCVGFVTVASAHPPLLVLQVPDAGLATELRFRANEVLERIRFLTDYMDFKELKIKVAVDAPQPRERLAPPLPLNESTRETMGALADSIEHPALKAALLKFSGVK